MSATPHSPIVLQVEMYDGASGNPVGMRRNLAVLVVAFLTLSFAVYAGVLSQRAAPAYAAVTSTTLDDEFDGLAGTPPTGWTPQVGTSWSHNEIDQDTDSPDNASLDGDGHLQLTALAQNGTAPSGYGYSYTSARLNTFGSFSAKYGSVEARIKLPSGAGLWPAFWMLGDGCDPAGQSPDHGDNWPDCGEIDVMEAVGQHPDVVGGHIHFRDASGRFASDGAKYDTGVDLTAGYHDYGVTWSPDQISYTFDGLTYYTEYKSELSPKSQWPFDGRFYLLLDLPVGGVAGTPDPAAFPATMSVDWIRVTTQSATTGPVVAVTRTHATPAVGTGWGWSEISPAAGGTPVLVRDRDRELTVGVGPRNRLLVHGEPSGWWRPPSGRMCSQSASAVLDGSHLQVVCRGMNGQLHATTEPLQAGRVPRKTRWGSLGGWLASRPAVAVVASHLTYFASGAHGRIFMRTAGAHASWVPTRWYSRGAPTVATSETGTTVIAFRSLKNTLRYATHGASGSWSRTIDLGGSLIRSPAIAAEPAQTVFYGIGAHRILSQRTATKPWVVVAHGVTAVSATA